MTLAQPAPSDKPTEDMAGEASSTPISRLNPTPEQADFLSELVSAMESEGDPPFLRLSGGPGVGKSFTIARAAMMAAEVDWCVFLIGPTHQATGVLAAAVPLAYPFEPDPKNMLSAGEVMYCTAHRMGMWVQKSRARQAASGVTDPVPRDSWLGRSFRASWDSPPAGCLIICDETSMYPGQMVEALRTTVATLKREVDRVVFVAVGDPHQLTPVRGPSYAYLPGEGPESPSIFVTAPNFKDHRLTVNVRAKDPMLRKVVETYLHHKTVPMPTEDAADVYWWAEQNDTFFESWARMIGEVGAGKCIMLGYRRATAAAANERMCRILHGVSASELQPGRMMRVQETYSPRGRTLAASSDLVEVREVRHVENEALGMIMPPQKGHDASYDSRVIAIIKELLQDDIAENGPLPVATVQVMGDRAGILRNVPVQVMTEADGMTATETRWAKLEGAITIAAFRRPHPDTTVRRGLAAIHYFMADSAKLRLEAPYAMTSHRAQGSTYAHVAVLADGAWGGRIVDFRVASARDASAYVMLSRASESLTIAWTQRLAPIVANAPFAL